MKDFDYDYIVADTHFGHIAILTFEPSRLVKMQIEGHASFDETMLEIWNDTVRPKERVLHLGDVAFGAGFRLARQLHGEVSLLPGNHDRKEQLKKYRGFGWEILEGLGDNLGASLSQEQRTQRMLNARIFKVEGRPVLFSHFPVFDANPYDEKFNPITHVLEEVYLQTGCIANVHGHTHSSRAKESFCLNMCLEANDFKLVSATALMQTINKGVSS